ncbi:hypothetical protein [Sphingobium nicotianae]|uniref:L,D-transpeptidase n=1 Tax=Sphingobium nicotianae TaxID=2782607 RepID=A0A9X1IST5_9SPHN|nr:hypothetical protein [Sphingobium nicotianae]MBT2188911.1 hypothetical protein [Sphingobium nicotianae]
MIKAVWALAGLALFVPIPALAAMDARPSASATAEISSAKAPDHPARDRSPAASRVIDWIASSGDNRSLPYIVVDKTAAAAFLFDAQGNILADAPVLIGIAVGDEATPGIGAKSLAEIGPAEKTTPAGRFLAKFGLAAGRQKVLWVDYATSVAMHPIPKANPKEKRRQRMLSPTPDDNRITFGCINVPLAFYNKGVRPQFQKKGGYVYVLPDTKALEDVFPPLHARPLLTDATH